MALNYQKQDRKCFLNDAQFSQNGGCGYVLKPEYLTRPNPNYSPLVIPSNVELNSRLLYLTIISGQHIPKGNKDGIAAPYVKARIFGHKDEDDTNQLTTVVSKNGFNPFWNETFHFFVKAPDLAFLQLTVKDKQNLGEKLREKKTKDPDLGSFVCPINLLHQGKPSMVVSTYAYNASSVIIVTNFRA